MFVFLSGFSDAVLQNVHKKMGDETQPLLHYHVKLSSWFVFVLFLPEKENINGEEYFAAKNQYPYFNFILEEKKSLSLYRSQSAFSSAACQAEDEIAPHYKAAINTKEISPQKPW